jgi:hypothetical protein
MQAMIAWRRRFFGSKPAVSDTYSGAVLNGFMIGNSAPIVRIRASRKIEMRALPQIKRRDESRAPSRI